MPIDLSFLDAYPALLTKKETAELLRRSERSVDRLAASGRLDAIKVVAGAGSSQVLITKSSLEVLLRQAAR